MTEIISGIVTVILFVIACIGFLWVAFCVTLIGAWIVGTTFVKPMLWVLSKLRF